MVKMTKIDVIFCAKSTVKKRKSKKDEKKLYKKTKNNLKIMDFML